MYYYNKQSREPATRVARTRKSFAPAAVGSFEIHYRSDTVCKNVWNLADCCRWARFPNNARLACNNLAGAREQPI